MESGKAIYSILNADSAVTTLVTGIYGNEARQGLAFPCVVYTEVSNVPVNTKSGFQALSSRVQVSCFAETYEAVNALALVVRASLADKAMGIYGGVMVQNIKFDNSQDFTESGAFDGIYHISLDFIIFYTL